MVTPHLSLLSAPRINLSRLSKSFLSTMGLSAILALAACSNAPTTTNNAAIQSPNSSDAPAQFASSPLITCPPYNPEQTMCTAQYDPVCVKIKSGATVSYRTAGNACSACGTATAIGYINGKCNDNTR